jgi:4-diphosphocytidyl-2C-methyl-D-erythritol kinase
LTSDASNRILRVCRKEADLLDLNHAVLINDLEATVFRRYPEIERVKSSLLASGAVNAAMSGSGASVFAILDNKETRQAAQKALEQHSTWRKFAVSTISRSQYREALRC